MRMNLVYGTGRSLALIVAVGLIAAFVACSTLAQTTRTWTGQGGDNNWTTGGNWGGTAPSAGEYLAFGGTTRLEPENNFAAGSSFPRITFNSGAGPFTLTGNSIELAWSGTSDVIRNNSSNLQTINLDLILPATANRRFLGSGDIHVGGDISGPGSSITMAGTGTLTLTGQVNLTGGLGVTSGTMIIDNAATEIGSTGSGTTSITGSLQLDDGTVNTHTLNLNSGASSISGGAINATDRIRIGNTSSAQVFNQTGGAVGVNGNIWLADQSGAGTHNLSGGTTTVTSAYTIGTRGNAVVNVSGTGKLTVGTLNFGHSVTPAGRSGEVNLNGGVIEVNRIAKPTAADRLATFNFNGGTLVARESRTDFMTGLTRANVRDGGAFIDTNGFNVTIGQALLHSNIGGDAAIDGGLTKLGAGTLTLSGVNTYTGATLIDGGTLALGGGGSIANSSTITVGTGATLDVSAVSGGWTLGASQALGGTGLVTGNATIAGNLNPGTSAGVLGFGNDLTLGSGATTTMEILGDGMVRGTDYDGIDVAAILGYGGTLNLDVGTTFGMGSYQFNLFDFGSHTGSFSSVGLFGDYNASLIDDGFGVWSAATGGGNEFWTFTQGTGILDLTVVPEPGAWLLLLMAAACGLLVRRRK